MSQNVDRVYKFGCHAPLVPEENRLAEQILGQAWLYEDELRRAYNAQKREIRTLRASGDDISQVIAYEHKSLNARLCEARSRRGHLLDYGTYWLVDAAMLAASKASRLDPIKRRNWDGTGRIGAAIQSIAKFPALEWAHNRVFLSSPDARGHAILTIRVGPLAECRSITWPIKLHRAFPSDAVVKQVALQLTRVGHRFRWQALITINYAPPQRDKAARGTVGVDVGWRADTGIGTRVATHDGIDEHGVLHIDTLKTFAYTDGVKAIRDRVFDTAKIGCREFGVPGMENAHLWRNKERMRRIADRKQDLGPCWWREVDRHLEDIECSMRARAVRRRLYAFRGYADMLAKRYRYVSLEDMPMGDWVGEAETSGLERRRSVAALSLLQTVIAERFGAARTDWVPREYTSMTCSECGVVRSESVGPAVRWKCEECGTDHHQDENAGRVLRLRSEQWIGEGNPPRARTCKAKKGDRKRNVDGIATGDDIRMVTTSRRSISEAAE